MLWESMLGLDFVFLFSFLTLVKWRKIQSRTVLKDNHSFNKCLFKLYLLILLHAVANPPPSYFSCRQDIYCIWKPIPSNCPHFHHPSVVSEKVKSPQSFWQAQTRGHEAAARASWAQDVCNPYRVRGHLLAWLHLLAATTPHCGCLAMQALQKHWVVFDIQTLNHRKRLIKELPGSLLSTSEWPQRRC